ncbi:MAG: AmmeMemoRadiSam system protein A [Anaerolineae bacterium]|nr:AmmeMemoRadiSam system protein A [Anaerolineae bacterium]
MESERLSSEEREFLLVLARNAISQKLEGKPTGSLLTESVPERLQLPGAAFVTLHTRHGVLRGCIGSLQARRPLVEDVWNNALAAAFEDLRFSALTSRELPGIVIEVSVLSTPQPLEFDNGDELLHKLRPRVDGVVLESGWHRATFLPQVWDQLPTPVEFLRNLCYKAGLPADAWRNSDVKISTYQVDEFSEES